MARARNIKPGFFTNAGLVELDPLARLLFIGLWCLADREGRLEDRPKTIKLQLLPGDDCNVDTLLKALHEAEFIVRYKNQNGSFIAIPGFSTHQSPHYSEKQSGIKPPPFRELHGYEERANPGEHRDKTGSTTGAAPESSRRTLGVQPPDSLNPDSLNPDSLNPEPTHRSTKRSASSGASAMEPAVAALRMLVEADERITLPAKGRMHLGQWATEGLKPEQLAVAIRLARQRKPHPELIPFAYLVPIVEDVKAGRATDPEEPRGKAAIPEALRRIRAREEREAKALAEAAQEPPRAREPAPLPGGPGPEFEDLPEDLNNDSPSSEEAAGVNGAARWWEDPDRVMERAVELQVQVFDGERFGDFTARVLATLGPGPHEGLIEDHDLLERIRYFAAVGPNTDAARPAS